MGKTRPGTRLIVQVLAAVALVGALCGSLYQREASAIEQRWREREQSRLNVLANFVHSSLQPAVADLQLLADGDGIQAFLVTGAPSDLARAVRRAAFISRLRSDYDQVRFLDLTGREVLRVNHGGVSVAEAALQDKSDRPYFKRAVALKPGQVYVSALDLNVEGGRVERPLKPVLRFAAPVFDGTGTTRGIYVINYLGQNLIERLQTAVPLYSHRLRLLDARGYWVKGSEATREWGFQASEAPLWARVAREGQGQASRAGGLFTWMHLLPQEFSHADGVEIVSEDVPFLVLASEIQAPEFDGFFADLKRTFLVLTLGLLVLATSSAWFLHGRTRALGSLRDSEENLSVTLHSIGDGVLATDTAGTVTRMNEVAERLTGWSQAAAQGRPIAEVFRIVNEDTREPAHIPVADVLATGELRSLETHTILVARDGSERAIADSAAPIRNADGGILGVVLVFRDVTAESAARAALRESEARYRTLFDSIDEGFCILEVLFDANQKAVDYRFLEVNPSFEKQSGLRDAVGRTMRSFAPDLEEYWFETFGRIALTGEATRFKNRAEPLQRSFEMYAFRLGDPAARHVAVLFVDITERERAQAELDRFFSLSLDLLCISSADGYFKRVSPAVQDLLGWSVEEFLATPYIDNVHPDDHEATLQEVTRQMKSGERVLHFENRYRHKNGSWRVLSWRSVPYGDLMYAIARDVTDLKTMEQALRESNERLERRVEARTAELLRTHEVVQHSERRFRALIEHGADGISVIDARNNILYLSPAVAAIEGYTAEELAGQNGLDNTHPDDLPLVGQLVDRLVANPGKPIPVLWRRRHKDGRWLWLEGVATNLLDDPAVKGIVTNYRDVTERKRAEAEIQLLNRDLERRVSERTAQLENANTELESFSYSVSHDLRAPLRHVQGFVEMLGEELQGGLSAKAERYMKTIASAAGEMGQLIDDLLSFSKMGRAEMRETTVDLDAVVRKTRERLERSVGERRVEWQVEALPRVQGDPAMLNQVLANLLDNAVKYTRPRDPARIEVGCSGREGERVVLYVRDNGAGFEMKYADKLFGVFQRLHRAEEFEGTGIGLATVRRIVGRHGGRVWAESALDRGSTFYFTVKAVDDVKPESEASA